MRLKRIGEYIRYVSRIINTSMMGALQFQSNMTQGGVKTGLTFQAMEHSERIFKVHVARAKGVFDAIVPTVPLKHLAVIVAPANEGTVF
jgi:hypothetical protein